MTLLERALSAIPGYDRTAATAEHLSTYKDTGIKPTLPAAQIAAEAQIRDLVAAGEPIPPTIGQALAEAEAADRAAQLQAIAMRAALAGVDTDVKDVIIDGLDSAFGFLDTELESLIDSVREHAAKLHGINDSTTALTNGPETAAAWASIAQLTDPYDEIRTVQVDLFRRGTSVHQGIDKLFNTAGLYRDFIDVSDFFIGRRARAVADYRASAGSAQSKASTSPATLTYVEWLAEFAPAPIGTESDDTSFSWWRDGDRVVDLIRIATTTQPWVPGLHSLNTAFNAAITATRPLTMATPPQMQARAEVYKLTATTTRFDLRVPDFTVRQLMDDGSANIMKPTSKSSLRNLRRSSDPAAALNQRIAHARGNHVAQRQASEEAARREATTRD